MPLNAHYVERTTKIAYSRLRDVRDREFCTVKLTIAAGGRIVCLPPLWPMLHCLHRFYFRWCHLGYMHSFLLFLSAYLPPRTCRNCGNSFIPTNLAAMSNLWRIRLASKPWHGVHCPQASPPFLSLRGTPKIPFSHQRSTRLGQGQANNERGLLVGPNDQDNGCIRCGHT